MGDFDALAETEQMNGMIADDVPAAQRHDGELVRAAWAGPPFSSMAQREVGARFAHGLREPERRAAGGVDFLPVVRFDDLDVVVRAQSRGGHAGHLGDRFHAGAHVGGPEDGDRFRKIVESSAVGAGEPGRAAHQGHARPLDGARQRRHGGGIEKIDDHVGPEQTDGVIVRHGNADVADAGNLAHVATLLDGVGRSDGADDLVFAFLLHEAHDGLPHATGGAVKSDSHAPDSCLFRVSTILDASRIARRHERQPNRRFDAPALGQARTSRAPGSPRRTSLRRRATS